MIGCDFSVLVHRFDHRNDIETVYLIVVFLQLEAHGSAAHGLSDMAMWSSKPVIHLQTTKVPTLVYHHRYLYRAYN